MDDEHVKTKVRPGGLRYESKTPGSEFPGSFGLTLSCLRCGKHMPRSQMRVFNLAGRMQFRCKDGC
jgi:hypothetical protein